MRHKNHPAWSCALITIPLLLVCAGGVAKQKDGSTDATDDDKIYGTSSVDEKAVIDVRSFNRPNGVGCRKSKGKALVRAILRKTGEVTDVEIREKSECEEFDQRAVRAVKKLKFKPAKKNGIAVSQVFYLSCTYTDR